MHMLVRAYACVCMFIYISHSGKIPSIIPYFPVYMAYFVAQGEMLKEVKEALFFVFF